MMINIDELKASLDSLNQLISDYEEIHLNMSNNLSSTMFSWNDVNSKKFLVCIDNEKKDFNTLISNYKSYYDIYKYIYEQYSKFGKVIYYELENKESIYASFDKYISKLEGIIYKYDNSMIINDSSLSYKIYNERRKLNETLENVKSIYSDVKNFYNSINDIDLEISERMSKIDIRSVQEISITDYV